MERAFVMIDLETPEFISEIHSLLPEEVIYTNECPGMEKETHVTLFPLVSNKTPLSGMVKYLPSIEDIVIHVSGISVFRNEKFTVLKADITVDSQIHRLNSKLSEHFISESEFKEYHPHVTIAYLRKDTTIADKFIGEFVTPIKLKPKRYHFNWISNGKERHCYFTK